MTARRLLSWLLFRLAAKLARFAVWLQRDGAGAVLVAIYADDAVLGSWHRGHSGYAIAAATVARAEAEHLDHHVATLDEIDAMTKTISTDPP